MTDGVVRASVPRFGLLGPLQLRSGDAVVPVTAAKMRVVIATLLLDAGLVVSPDRLSFMIWNGREPPSARVTLQGYLSRTRRLLRRPDTAESASLRTHPGGYSLELGADELDLRRFDGLVTAASSARERGELHAAVEMLQQALALWRGPVLADVQSTALHDTEARRWEDRRLLAFEECADMRLSLGEHAAVCSDLSALVDEHPLRERLRALLMVALYRSGRRAEALQHYLEGRRVSVRETGLEPGPSLRQVQQAILTEAPELAPRSQGRQVLATGQPPVAPAPSYGPGAGSPDVIPATADTLPLRLDEAESAVPFQLPGDIPTLVGRQLMQDAAVQAITSWVRQPAAIGLVGAPGTGKSVLAVRVGHQTRERFPDGVLYLPLGGRAGTDRLREPDAVLAVALAALGIARAAVPTGAVDRLGLYRTLVSRRSLLVVADDADCEAAVRPLLPSTRRSVLLVTSRSRLDGLDGVTRLVLGPLAEQPALELLAAVCGQERVEAELQAAAAIVDLCGGVPLAVRIAGGRLQTQPQLSLGAFVERLRPQERRLQELISGDRDLAAVYRDEWERQSPADQELLRRLAAVRVDFDEDAVAELAVDAAPGRALDRLLGRHLAEFAGPGPSGKPRYRLHQLLSCWVGQCEWTG
jgi:DNA-binding SARP family transcriptional activator